MGWEERKGRQYYYTAERVGGRVVKRYVGGGRAGELVAQLNASERDQRETDRQMLRIDQDRVLALDAPLNELNELAGLVARAALHAAGFHQHRRGEWRKRRARHEPAG